MMPIVKKTNKTKRNLSYYHVNKFALVGILRAIEQDNNAIQKRYYSEKSVANKSFLFWNQLGLIWYWIVHEYICSPEQTWDA